jgi:hypothetical protein
MKSTVDIIINNNSIALNSTVAINTPDAKKVNGENTQEATLFLSTP